MNMDSDPGIQEQAFHMMRHIADTEDGAELVFDSLSPHVLLGFVSNALESDDEDVVRQVSSSRRSSEYKTHLLT